MKKLLFFIKKIKPTKTENYTDNLNSNNYEAIEINNNSHGFEYVVLNNNYKNFNLFKSYPVSIKIIMNKDKSIEFEKREKLLDKINFKFKFFFKTKGELLFVARKETTNFREILYYTNYNTFKKLNINSLNESFSKRNKVKVIIEKDKDWSYANEFFNLKK